MGRPSKLTCEVQQTLVFALAEGATVEHACDYAGIHKDTFYDWLQRGAAGVPAFSDFSDAVTRARGQGVVTDLLTISHAVRAGDWKAAAWRLQHRYPQEYGAKLNISGDADHPLRVLHDLPQDQLDARIRALLAQTGYGTVPGEVPGSGFLVPGSQPETRDQQPETPPGEVPGSGFLVPGSQPETRDQQPETPPDEASP